ncbi:MAG: GHKL domain-containing protein, partial [Planctomycetes bacterium]|nr:GHKL domain-containing protein [Planctomycetota bacterium]
KKPAVVEHAHCNRDSRGHVFEYHAHPIFDEAGEVFQIIEYSLDITDRKKAEEEVARLAKFPDENLNPVLRISREGEILYANTGSRPLLDAWQTELHDCIPQKWYELVQQASHSDQMRQCEIKCGEQIFSLTFTPVADFGYVNIYGMDITDRKKAEADREYVLKELTAKTKELESIVYVASHDLRSPLVNIQGFSQELRDNCTLIRSTFEKEEFKSLLDKDLLTVLDEGIPEAVRFISASTRMMDSLLSGLLRLSRLSRVELEIRKLDMNALMSNVVGSMSYQIKEVAAKVQIDPLDSCLGDESQIGQIFTNILDNALKYLDNSRPGMIHVSCSEKDDCCVYCVEDNGIGIDLEHQSKIFEIFHRLDPGRTEGEGLGLTTARRILDRHDGSIWVESEPGKASRFFISVPKA